MNTHTQTVLIKTQRVNGDLLTSQEDLRKGGAVGSRGGRAEKAVVGSS